MSELHVSRRTFLHSLGLGATTAAGLALAGCGKGDDKGGSGSPTGNGGATVTSGSTQPGASTGAASGKPVTISVAIVPDPTGAEQFYRDQLADFSKKNPHIKVNVISNPAAQEVNAVTLMFQQNKGPDVYRAQGATALNQFIDHGWAAPLDQYVTDDFLARFPKDSFNPKLSGLHVNGKLYSLPLVWGKWTVNNIFIYNKKLLSAAGYSVAPKTWSEMTAAATAITKKGNGKAFGFAPLTGSLGGLSGLQQTAGPYSINAFGIDLRTGKAALSDTSLVDVVELVRKLQTDKIMTTGWEGWKDDTSSYIDFAKERLGMYVGGDYHVNEIRNLNKDIDMGITSVPVPDAGRGGYQALRSSFTPIWSMSAKSEHPDEAWQVMDFLCSVDFQRAYFEKFQSLTAVEGAWRSGVTLTDDLKQIISTHDDQDRSAPDPTVGGTPGAAALMKDLSANKDLKWSDSALPCITHNEDFAPKAAALDTKIDQFLASDITKLNGVGTKVELSDITYPDWDPTQAWVPAS